MKNKKGFTLIELLVVVAIMGLLASLAIVALSQARLRARDARRVADIKQIQTALELYYLDNNAYPIDAGGDTFKDGSGNPEVLEDECLSKDTGLAAGCSGTVYMGEVPANPSPRGDGSAPACDNTPYKYNRTGITTYEIEYCLGSATGDLAEGYHCATPAGISEADDSKTSGC